MRKLVVVLVLVAGITASASGQAVMPPGPEFKKADGKIAPPPPFPDLVPEELPKPIKAPEVKPLPRPYDVFEVVPDNRGASNPELVGIGFFNHSNRELVLEVGERSIRIASRKYQQLRLPREFVWREKDGETWTTKVPAEWDGVEIVFKK